MNIINELMEWKLKQMLEKLQERNNVVKPIKYH